MQITEELRQKLMLPYNIKIEGCHVIALNDDEVNELKTLGKLKAFEIDGFGTEMYKLLLENKSIRQNPILMFDPKQRIPLTAGRKRIFNAGLAKFRAEGIGISTIIKSLVIDGCGKAITQQFARKLYDQEYSIRGLSKDVWMQLVNRTNEINSIVQQLEVYGYTVYNDAVEETTREGIKVVLTGSPKAFGYATKEQFLQQNTQYVEVKKLQDADYLITDNLNGTSSKMQKAKKLNINIITYVEHANT